MRTTGLSLADLVDKGLSWESDWYVRCVKGDWVVTSRLQSCFLQTAFLLASDCSLVSSDCPLVFSVCRKEDCFIFVKPISIQLHFRTRDPFC